MSRTATATPPPTYFPQRNATPTMRHCSAPNVTAVHFASRHPHPPHMPRRKSRNVSTTAGAFVGALSPKKRSIDLGTVTPAEDALGMSFEDISPIEAAAVTVEGLARTRSPIHVKGNSSNQAGQDEDGDQIMGRITPTPSMSTSYSESFTSTTLPTPSSSRAPSLLQPEIMVDTEAAARSGVPIVAPAPIAVKPSWVPYLGKMAKAVVTTGFSPFADKKKKETQHLLSAPTSPRSTSLPSSPSHKDEAVFVPCGPTPRPTFEELSQLSDEAALERRKEWAMEQQRRVTECARLCSQWPQSGYNQSKWGPNGSRNYYEPQSYANPQYVASLMTRQADLERQMHQQCALHYTCRNYRASSEGSSMMDSEASLDSYESAHTSPTSLAASLSLSADLSAAMASPLISSHNKSASQVSLLPVPSASASPSKGTQSLTELDTFSKVSLDSSVELDPEASVTRSSIRTQPAVRPARAQSCGAKRPLTTNEAYEEEKRRRVDEAAVVSEAVDSGVIMPPSSLKPPVIGSKQMSASVPDLSAAKASTSGAVFGHMVKTSDTHPIIISPFFPAELIPIIARSVIFPQQDIESASGFMLGSKIDVPSLLLSFAPPARPNGNVVVPSLAPMVGSACSEANGEVKLGNLLLSSCPGKRLRMEGPVKGRGPVCRDLATDLRRIKSEGVGCLVCCLDDPELALLGVPWETYHQVAIEIGLDVIRLPMPDGFTPVSLNLFDEQVSMIVRDYSLKGINVLVHCRGGVGRAGLTASAWAIKMGLVPPHPSLVVVEEAAHRQAYAQAQANDQGKRQSAKVEIPAELEHQIVMSIVERVIAMIRSRRGLKAIESFEQVQFLASYVRWIRATSREARAA